MTPRISNGILDMAMTLWPWSYHIHIHWAQLSIRYDGVIWGQRVKSCYTCQNQFLDMAFSNRNPNMGSVHFFQSFSNQSQWRFRNFTPNLIFSPCCSLKPQINKKSKNHGTHADPLTSGAHTERPGHRPKPWPAGKKRWGHGGCNQRINGKTWDVDGCWIFPPWLSNFRKTHDKIWQGDLGIGFEASNTLQGV